MLRSKTLLSASALLTAAGLMTGCLQSNNSSIETTASNPLSCLDITPDLLNATAVTIDTIESVSADDSIALDHCLVQGSYAPHLGIDNKEYTIGFELRLPNEWNRRFAFQFNGGTDGEVISATGRIPVRDNSDSALNRGFAVISTDAGHDGTANPDAGLAGSARFGLDPQARIDYGYGAVTKMTPVAKQMIEAYYDNSITYSYGLGVSNGGRHAMVAATRIPEAFDGLLVGYPGFNLPKAAIQHAWDIQHFSDVDTDIATAYTQETMNYVSQTILDSCDSLDGLTDHMVNDVEACQAAFDPTTLSLCTTDGKSECVSLAQRDALIAIHAGPRNTAGDDLYSNWVWDAGINDANWRFWKLESGIPPWGNLPVIAVMGAGSLAQVFTTPPTEVGGTPEALEQFLLDFDFDTDAPKIAATTTVFSESALSFMRPLDVDNPTMGAFRDAGHKMIIMHGTADPVFSVADTTRWYDLLNANNGNQASNFTKLYRIPGMPHGSGGYSTDNIDMLTELMAWVEDDQEPVGVEATTTPTNSEVPDDMQGITRTVCPYPLIATYTGTDPRSAASFTCQ